LPFGAGGPAAGCGSAATVGSTATVAAADREPSPPLAGAGVRRQRGSPPAPDKPGPPLSANKNPSKTPRTSESGTSSTANRGLSFGAGGPASAGPAATVGQEPHQSRPGAERSEPKGRGGPGDPSTSTPAPPSAGAAAVAPAETGQGLPVGRCPAAAGQPPADGSRGLPAAAPAAAPAPAGSGPAGRGGPSTSTTPTTAPPLAGLPVAGGRGPADTGQPVSDGSRGQPAAAPDGSSGQPAAAPVAAPARSGPAGRGGPGAPSTSSTPTPTVTTAPPSAVHANAAVAPAGVGKGLSAGRGPAATGQPDRSRPAAAAPAGSGPAGRGGLGGPSTLTPTPNPTVAAAVASAASAHAAQRVPARFNLEEPESDSLAPPSTVTVPAAPPGKSKKARAAPVLKAAAHSFRESHGLLRGYALSFRVLFRAPEQRSSRTAATTVIQRALCVWGRKQRLGFTLDVRETTDSLEGIVEGVHNGNVTDHALAALRTQIHELLRSAKKKKRKCGGEVWKCEYSCHVYDTAAKPEEMVTSYIVRNGVRTGYERLQTTRPDVVELAQTEAAATVPARETSGGARRPSGSSRSVTVSDVLAAVEAERHCVQNKVAQISSFKDAMECVGDVVQIVELLYKFLQQRAYLEEGGPPGFRESRATVTPTPTLPPSTPAAAAMAGRRSPCLCLCFLSYRDFSFRFCQSVLRI